MLHFPLHLLNSATVGSWNKQKKNTYLKYPAPTVLRQGTQHYLQYSIPAYGYDASSPAKARSAPWQNPCSTHMCLYLPTFLHGWDPRDELHICKSTDINVTCWFSLAKISKLLIFWIWILCPSQAQHFLCFLSFYWFQTAISDKGKKQPVLGPQWHYRYHQKAQQCSLNSCVLLQPLLRWQYCMLQIHIAQPLRCVSGEALQLNDRPRMLVVTWTKSFCFSVMPYIRLAGAWACYFFRVKVREIRILKETHYDGIKEHKPISKTAAPIHFNPHLKHCSISSL